MSANPFIFLLLLFNLGGAACLDEPVENGSISAELKQIQGYWRDEHDSLYLLGLEGPRMTISYDGGVREVAMVMNVEAGRARLCSSGRNVDAGLKLSAGQLVFHDRFRDETHHLFRLRQKPEALCLSSFHLPAPSPISESQVSEIQRELSLRNQQDQALLRPIRQARPPDSRDLPWLKSDEHPKPGDPDLEREIRLVGHTIENTLYVRNLVSKVGWIDVGRFGFGASNAAFLLVQHSWDVPLMRAVLPQLKEDVDRGLMERDTYALLYDRLQLALGHPQLYGSQIARDSLGVFVLPVADPAHVEERRRQLGLIPLAEYVRVFGADEVRFSSECAKSGL
jgi:hypothetical protein